MKRETWLPATPASARTARSLVREAAAGVGLDGERAWDLTLAATEAFANAVEHGEPWPNGCVLFVTQPCPRGLRVEVCDLGTFDSTLEPAPLEATSGPRPAGSSRPSSTGWRCRPTKDARSYGSRNTGISPPRQRSGGRAARGEQQPKRCRRSSPGDQRKAATDPWCCPMRARTIHLRRDSVRRWRGRGLQQSPGQAPRADRPLAPTKGWQLELARCRPAQAILPRPLGRSPPGGSIRSDGRGCREPARQGTQQRDSAAPSSRVRRSIFGVSRRRTRNPAAVRLPGEQAVGR